MTNADATHIQYVDHTDTHTPRTVYYYKGRTPNTLAIGTHAPPRRPDTHIITMNQRNTHVNAMKLRDKSPCI